MCFGFVDFIRRYGEGRTAVPLGDEAGVCDLAFTLALALGVIAGGGHTAADAAGGSGATVSGGCPA